MRHRRDCRIASWRAFLVIASLWLLMFYVAAPYSMGQDNAVPIDAADIQSVLEDEPNEEAVPPTTPSGIDLLTLMTRGGAFMVPICVMSLMVVALAFERMLNLRKRKVLPRLLVRDLRQLADPIEQFSPKAALQSCVDQPSPAARVVTAMLLRTGQPLADIERTATEAIEREADQHGAPIRWLSLAAAATPLMGLLGTVWGMIVAFHESTTLTPDRSRSEQLSEGIYTALVTTLAGLVVAIPAAIMALYLENRLAKLFHRVELLAFEIAPGLARFAGKRRMDREGNLYSIDGPPPPPAETGPPPAASHKSSAKRGGAKAG